jgi:hypothetical protein
MVFISGGGGVAIAEYLLPHFENTTLVKEAQFANVYGFRKPANITPSLVEIKEPALAATDNDSDQNKGRFKDKLDQLVGQW